jgi:hypothetical protein
LGLRARLTVTYALGAALLSAFLSITTFGLTRENLLEQREQAATTQAVRNAATLDPRLKVDGDQEQSSVQALLTSLATPEGGNQLVHYGGAWTSSSTPKF